MTDKSSVQEGQCEERMEKVHQRISSINNRLYMIMGAVVVIGFMIPYLLGGLKELLNLRFEIIEKKMPGAYNESKNNHNEWFTVQQASNHTKLSRQYIYALCSKNQIEHVKIGRNIRIKRTVIEKYMDARVYAIDKPKPAALLGNIRSIENE